MDDVFLEGATPDGPAVVGHLSVIVDTEGITFLGPEPGDRRTVGWDRMSPLEFGPPAALPDGMAVTSLEFELDGRPLRLLVPSKTGPTGEAWAEASEPSAEVVVATAPDVSGPTEVQVVPGVPLVVESAFVPTPAAAASPVLSVDSTAPVVEIPVPVVEIPVPVAESAAAVIESPVPVVESAPTVIVEIPVPAVDSPPTVIVSSPAPAIESPPPVIAESPVPVVESPTPVVVETPVPAVESPPQVVVETPVPAVESPPQVVVETPVPVVDSPPTVIVSSPTPVAESPPPVIVEIPGPAVDSRPTVIVSSPTPVVESPAPVVESPAPVVEIPVSVHPVDDVSATEPELEETPGDEAEWAPTPPRSFYRSFERMSIGPRAPQPLVTRRMLRLVLVAALAGLIPLAAGVWYAHLAPGGASTPARTLSDAKIAALVGIQPGDLPTWSSTAPRTGNAFAAGATSNGALGLSTAVTAATSMARCLHVPISAVEGAFGMGNAISQRTAEVTSPSYADPSGNGGSVNSVVDVVKTPQILNADANVFQDPSLFATCYQPYVQAMLPFTTVGGPGPGFATATVQPIVVPVPAGPGNVEVAAFQIARIANDPGQTTTVVTTAIAVFGGRVQATIGTVSNFVFSIDAQNQLVHNVEVRTIGVSAL
jgi:hypothetical protein